MADGSTHRAILPSMSNKPDQSNPTTHVTSLRVRYAECDPMNVAHHASYLPWLEIGRTEMLRATGASYEKMERDGLYLVITRCEVKYRRPIRYDDVLDIRTTLDSASKIKLRHTYEVALTERQGRAPDPTDPAVPDDLICAIATTELACVDRSGKPTPLPDFLAG